jgi:hypothetical protein
MADPSHKLITQYIERMAIQTCDITPDAGDPISYAEKLAETIWRFALGYKEVVDGIEKRYKPATWAINHILDRLEGPVKADKADETPKRLVVNRIRELAKGKLNDLAEAAVDAEDSVPGHSDDMDGPDHGTQDTETA